jgi:hypothetical protein
LQLPKPGIIGTHFQFDDTSSYKNPGLLGYLRSDYAHSNTLRFEHGSLKTSNTARALAPPSGTSEVRMVSPSRGHRVGVAMASLPFKRVGVFGSSGIFGNLIPVGRGRIVFWRKQGPDKTETLSSLAGN